MNRKHKALGVLVFAPSVVAGVYFASQASATPSNLTPSEISLVQRLIATQVSASGKVHVAHATGAEVIDAYTPGEEPWGDDTTSYRTHDFLVVGIPGALAGKAVISAPPGYQGPALSTPAGEVVFLDLQTGEQVGGVSVASPAAINKVSLGKLASAAVFDVSVTPGP